MSTPATAVVLLPLALGQGALGLAGLILILSPALGPLTPGRALAIFHLSVVAGLLPVVLGAMTQLASATTARPYTPRQSLLQGFGPCLVSAGGLLLAGGFWTSRAVLLATGGALAVVGLALSLPAPALRALSAAERTPVHFGIGTAAVALMLAALAGTRLALGLAGVLPPAPGLPPVHVALAVVLGFTVLLLGVSWQLTSMFAQAPYPPRAEAWAILAAVAAAGVAAIAWPAGRLALLWLLGVLLVLFALSLSRRVLAGHRPFLRPARIGSMLWAWQLAAAPLALAVAPDGPRVETALLLAVYGGFLLAVYTHLDRILPFIVWIGMRRQAAGGPLPRLSDILPERGFLVALAVFEVGLFGAVVLGPRLLPLLGLGMALFSGRLLVALLRARRHRQRAAGTAA